MSFNSKGQESATFEFVIVAIIGLIILLIVLNIVNYFTDLRFKASWEEFKIGLKSAVSSPNGNVFYAEKIVLNTGGITTESLSNQTSIPAECFKIDSEDVKAFEVSEDNTMVSIKQVVTTTVYFRCVLTSEYATASGATCTESCLASFGKEIQTTPTA